ncbi:ATP-binding protein [Rhodanobacter aciditrophus]|uniref:histidine kinase n=1 Tax=Rhodanobacter aciditrophus TaxID=1623218 RepID=A0ABW4B0A5_9GAMM
MHRCRLTLSLLITGLLLALTSMGAQGKTFQITPKEQAWIDDHPYIIFVGDPNWLPFEAFTEDGQYIGIVSSFLKKFTQDTGINIAFRPTATWQESLDVASEGNADVISDVLGSATLYATHTFTKSYITNNLVLISNTVGVPISDINELSDAKIGLIKGYGYTWELYERYPDVSFVEVDNIQEGLEALENKEFNYLVSTYALGQFQLSALGKSGLHLRGQLDVETYLAFAVRKDWPELVEIFNRWINSLSPEQRYQIAESWYLENTDFFSYETVNWTYVAWLIVVILVLLGLIAYGIHSRSTLRQHKLRFETALAAINAVEWKMPRESARLDVPEGFTHILPERKTAPTTLNELIEMITLEDQERVYNAFRNARLSADGLINIEFRINTQTTCWLALKGSAINDFGKPYLAGTLENISYRKQVEAEKGRTDKLIALLFDAIPDLIFLDLFEPQDQISNKAYRRYFGDQSVSDTLSPEQLETWQKQQDTLIKFKHSCHFESWLSPTDAAQTYFSILRVPFIDDQGQVIGILSVARDMTDQYLLQQELQEAKHLADQANTSKTVFLANMSHEIRTPLNAILGYSQILTQSEHLNEEESRQINRVHLAGRRLLGLINDILDLSKIEAGKLQFNPEKVSLRQELEELLAIHRQRAQSKDLAFKEDIKLSKQDHVTVDRTKLGQILLNAIDNAIKFTESGSVLFKVEYKNGQLLATVTDTGPGISQDELDTLFQPFSQGTSGNINGGTGLGLVLSRRLATAMGGSFNLSSVVGQGTTVTIQIPMELTVEKEGSLPQRNQNWRLAEEEPKVALIIEDDELSRDLLKNILGRIGFNTLVAEDGEQALAILEKTDVVHMVFSDIRMPNMDGLTLIHHIRSQQHLANIPVVAVTASSFEHEKRYYLKNGFSDFVPKPVELEQLCRAIKKVFNMTLASPPPTKELPSRTQDDRLPPMTEITASEEQALVDRFTHACQLGDADEALFYLHKLQETSIAANKLDIIKQSLEHYDFDAALAVDLY